MLCSRCQLPPRMKDDPQIVAAYSPVEHLLPRVKQVAATAGASIEKQSEGLLVLRFPAETWQPFLSALSARTGSVERQELRFASLPTSEAEELSLVRAAFAAPNAEQWCAQVRHRWLIDVLEQRTLFSHYQPIVDIRSGEVHGIESLVRANGPDGGVASAASIITAAKQLDLLYAVDQQSRESAILNAEPLRPARVFINFLPSVIYNPAQCLATTWRALERTSLRPENIVFEVVESEQVENRADLVDILNHYRANGFRIALDDLGSGYSSLNMLAVLRPDYVKLDMELVQSAPSDRIRAGMIEAIAKLAADSGIRVIAEGIETLESARQLQDMGIELMQGYFFARPALIPAISTEALDAVQRFATAA